MAFVIEYVKKKDSNDLLLVRMVEVEPLKSVEEKVSNNGVIGDNSNKEVDIEKLGWTEGKEGWATPDSDIGDDCNKKEKNSDNWLIVEKEDPFIIHDLKMKSGYNINIQRVYDGDGAFPAFGHPIIKKIEVLGKYIKTYDELDKDQFEVKELYLYNLNQDLFLFNCLYSGMLNSIL